MLNKNIVKKIEMSKIVITAMVSLSKTGADAIKKFTPSLGIPCLGV